MARAGLLAADCGGSEHDKAMTLAVKWAYRYHSLQVDWFDSIDRAVGSAGYESDCGNEALDCIEVWDEDGYRRLLPKEVWALYNELERSREAATPPPKPVVARLYLTHPDGGERILWSTSRRGLRH